MSDDIDIANIEIERERERALSKNKQLLEENDILNCIECDIKIPEARKKAMPSAVKCIDCQELENNKRV
jgi:phage/conjugal plasmid C-4 type zinc finger TraR family protein